MEVFTLQRESTGAVFSDCRKYRYALWRHWDWQGHANCVMFIGLNPSTADETENDPTIRRCIRFARDWGYGGLYMMNLYAFRATKPADMVAADDSVGPNNLESFGYYRSRVGLIVAAWGKLDTRYRPLVNWQSQITRTIDAIGSPLHYLGYTSDRSPRHPLYMPADSKPVLFER